MKVGLHLDEGWESILARKLEEERTAGVAFWGYGGSVCHPLTQVRPFAMTSDEPVQVLFVRTRSDFFGSAEPATHWSVDRAAWSQVPNGVVCTGKHALVLKGLRQANDEIDLANYQVGIGPSAGVALPAYLRGRIDKACARARDLSERGAPSPVTLIARAELVAPYAVLLKSSTGNRPT